MVRKFGLLCLFSLALILTLGCASAQTRQDVYAELGVCDYADFADWEVETVVNGADKVCGPFPEAFDAESDMTLWQLPIQEYRSGNYVERFPPYKWFVSEGVLSQADFDLDGDGQDEWLVLCVQPGEPNDYDNWFMEPHLRVYEVSGGEVALADELRLDCTMEDFAHMTACLLRVDGEALFAYQEFCRADGLWTNFWLLTYADGKLAVRAGFQRAVSSDANDVLCVHGGDTDVQEFSDFSAPHREDGGDYVEYMGDDFSECYREALDELPAISELLDKVFQPMGGTSILADIPRYYEMADVALTLLDIDATADAPDGTPVIAVRFRGTETWVRATASVNLRSEPSLDGEKLGAVTEGTRLPWLGETRADDRGVDWYKVSFEGAEAWISSRYSERG